MAWIEERSAIETYRDGSDPNAFDVEFEIEFTVRSRRSDDDFDAEIDGPFTVTYYPALDAPGEPRDWNELQPEFRATLEQQMKQRIG